MEHTSSLESIDLLEALATIKQHLLAKAKAGNYDGVMAIYATMRGVEIDVMALTTLAGKLATDLVMR